MESIPNNVDNNILMLLKKILSCDIENNTKFKEMCNKKHFYKLMSLIDMTDFNIIELERFAKISETFMIEYFNLVKHVEKCDEVTTMIYFDIIGTMLEHINNSVNLKSKDFLYVLKFNNQFIGKGDDEHNKNMLYLCECIINLNDKSMSNIDLLEVISIRNILQS